MAVVASFGVAGCGAKYGTVTGKVLFQGTPLKGGNVTFMSEGNGDVSAPIGEDGSYTADKVPVGPVTITVETESLNPRDTVRPPQGGAYSPPKDNSKAGYKPPDRSKMADRYVPISPDYADAARSGLTYTVEGGKQQHDIKLDKGP